jgi:hypothetical protein
MKHEDPLAAIDAAQKVLAAPDANLAVLEAANRDLTRIIAGSEVGLEEIRSRRKIELHAHAPLTELNRKFDELDRREKEIGRRVEISNAVLAQLEIRIADARETERSAARQAAYDAAVKMRDETATLVRNFLDNVGPAARAALRAYSESEAATAAVNRDLPAGALPIPTIESERQGAALPAKIVERHFKAFVRGRDFVSEVGKVDAAPASGNTWNVFLPSNSIQGGTSVGGCTIVDFVDVRIEKFEPARPQVLSAALSVPSFYAPPPERGRVERKRMRLSEWRSLNGEPVEAEQELV